MDQYTPLPEPLSDHQNFFDMAAVFERVPLGDFTIRQMAGDYLGSYGPWEPKWSQNGCFSAVDLECQSECAYLAGCVGDDFTSQDFPNSSDVSRLKNHSNSSPNSVLSNGINVYPNPSQSGSILTIELQSVDNIESIELINANGKIVQNIPNARKSTINTSQLKPGFYVVKTTFSDSSITRTKVSIVK